MRVLPTAIVALACITASCGTETAQPNVILILADDLGYCDSELYGCDTIPTPNLKRLADQGTASI